MRFSRQWYLDGDEAVDHAVEVVEERQKVEGKFNPALSLRMLSQKNSSSTHVRLGLNIENNLALVQSVCIHDGGGVIETGSRHHGSVHISEKGISK